MYDNDIVVHSETETLVQIISNVCRIFCSMNILDVAWQHSRHDILHTVGTFLPLCQSQMHFLNMALELTCPYVFGAVRTLFPFIIMDLLDVAMEITCPQALGAVRTLFPLMFMDLLDVSS